MARGDNSGITIGTWSHGERGEIVEIRLEHGHIVREDT